MHVRRLERELGDRVRIRRRTSLLRPEPNPAARFTEFHVEVYQRVMAHEPECRIRLPEIGQPYPAWSAPALEAWCWVAERHPDREAEFDWLLYTAFFGTQADIGNPAVLVSLATRLGLPGEDLRRSLAAAEYRARVLAEEAEWRALGFRQIPSVQAEGGPRREGVLGYEDYRQLVLEASS